ncbi:MAG: hypothetical protein C4540_06570 [Candidatus Omnitrophota bacterium]|nr:MAG: hypothetical protein C4540_06570 [Candidatus Omnitrophota bacterium]
MTGGGRGYCAMPVGETGRQLGGGVSGARGQGRGWRNCFYTTGLPGWMRAQRGMQAFGSFGRVVSKEDELETLKSRADFLKQQLEDTQARIQDMASQQESDKK